MPPPTLNSEEPNKPTAVPFNKVTRARAHEITLWVNNLAVSMGGSNEWQILGVVATRVMP